MKLDAALTVQIFEEVFVLAVIFFLKQIRFFSQPILNKFW